MIKELFCSLTLLIGFVATANTAERSHRHHHNSSCPEHCNTICKLPYTIKKPGNYCLGKNLIYSPTFNGQSAITVNADNVTIDGKDFSISQLGIAPSTVGIFINGRTNVAVTKLIVQNFTQSGILIGPNSQNINLRNLYSLNNGSPNVPFSVNQGMGGINGTLVDTLKISNCLCKGNFLSGCGLTDVINLHVEDCDFLETQAGTALDPNSTASFGFVHSSVTRPNQNLLFRNCRFNDCSGGLVSGGLQVFNLFKSNPAAEAVDVVVENCQANNNQGALNSQDEFESLLGPSASTSAILIFADGVSVTNCQTSNNVYTANITPSPATSGQAGVNGIIIEDSVGFLIGNCKIIDCQASNNQLILNAPNHNPFCRGIRFSAVQNNYAEGLVSEGNSILVNASGAGSPTLNLLGILFIGSNTKVIDSHAVANIITGPGAVGASGVITAGFQVGTTDIELQHCTSTGQQHNASNTTTNPSILAGFLVASNGTNVVFRECTASNNNELNTTSTSGFAFGFTTAIGTSHNNVVFEDCIALGNKGFAGISGGFGITNTTSPEMIRCVANSNTEGLVVFGTTTLGTFTKNSFSNNTNHGILDTTSTATNAYYSNKSKNNGATPLTTNYTGPAFPAASCPVSCVSANKTPVRAWMLPGVPCMLDSNCVSGEKLDNISISN